MFMVKVAVDAVLVDAQEHGLAASHDAAREGVSMFGVHVHVQRVRRRPVLLAVMRHMDP